MWSEQKVHLKLKTDTGGYDYQFVEEPPDSLKCLICLLVAREPQQHGGCGKLFCKSCISNCRPQKNDCPHCRQPLADLYSGSTIIFNDFKSDQEVKSLKVLCSKACDWKGELRALEEHISVVCENAEVPCPNECGNGFKVMRKNLHIHISSECPRRQVSCQQCKQMIEYKALDHHHLNKCPKRKYACPKCKEIGCYDERTTSHLKICPRVKIQCPKCSLAIFRCEETKHPDTCSYERVSCKYFEIGCKEKPLRKNLSRHEQNAELHLAKATEKVLQLTKMLVIKNTVTFEVTNFQEKKEKNEQVRGPNFYTSRHGYRMHATLLANGWGNGKDTHVSVYAYLMKGDNDDSLTWPFTGTVTFELLNQLEDKNHHEKTVTHRVDKKALDDGEPSSRGCGYSQFISHTDLGNQPHKNCQFLKNNKLVVRVSAEASDYKPWLECTPPNYKQAKN